MQFRRQEKKRKKKKRKEKRKEKKRKEEEERPARRGPGGYPPAQKHGRTIGRPGLGVAEEIIILCSRPPTPTRVPSRSRRPITPNAGAGRHIALRDHGVSGLPPRRSACGHRAAAALRCAAPVFAPNRFVPHVKKKVNDCKQHYYGWGKQEWRYWACILVLNSLERVFTKQDKDLVF